MAALPPIKVVQNAYIVRDVESACRMFHALYRIGPFLLREPRSHTDVTYRGSPAPEPLKMRTAFAQSGDLSIELIQPMMTGPNIYDDVVSAGTDGFHHVATWSTDYWAEKAAYVAAGFPVAMEIRVAPDCEVTFIDATSVTGHMLELYPDHPYLRDIYSEVDARTRTWNGVELIVPF